MSEGSADLFAAKGRALPACSEPLAERRPAAPAAAPAEALPAGQADNDAQGAGAASVLSIDLRAALAPADPPARETPPPAAPAPAPTIPAMAAPAPAARSGTLAWTLIAACLVVAVAAGLFFAAGPQWLDAKPAAQAPGAEPSSAPAAAEHATPADGTASDRSVADRSVADRAAAAPSPDAEGDTPQEAAPESAQAPAEEPRENERLPSFDLVRVEPDGAAVIAGRAAPYAELILLHNGKPIGTATADWAGEWAFVTDQPLPADSHTISVLVNDPDAEVTLPQGANPPARMSETVDPGSR